MPNPATVVVKSHSVVNASAQQIPNVVVVAGIQGPPGPQGLAGDTYALVASTALSGHRILSMSSGGYAEYADHRNDSAQRVVGFSEQASVEGESVLIKQFGPLEWPANNLIVDTPVFLDESGLTTQIPPTTGWLRQVGIAVETNLLSVAIGPAYFLGE